MAGLDPPPKESEAMITLDQRDALMAKPAIAPNLPPEVATFDCIDFGGYCARGYNPCQIAGHIRNVPLKHLTEGEWLSSLNTGSAGSVFVFREAAGHEVGRAFKPSTGVISDLCFAGKWPTQLTFTRTPAALAA